MHELEGNRRASESFFVPRQGGSGAEDDGYLLCYATVFGTQESDLYILDAATMDMVAIISLGGAFVPGGFHGFWIDAEKYAPGKQRLEGLQAEPSLLSLPQIGELDWTGAKL